MFSSHLRLVAPLVVVLGGLAHPPTRAGEPAGAPLRVGAGQKVRIGALAFSPDGKLLATCAWGEKLQVWDGASGKLRRELDFKLGPGETTTSSTRPVVTFSPDGKLLAAARSPAEHLRLWDHAAGKEVRKIPKQNGWFDCIAFSPDGKTLALASHLSGEPYLLHDVATGRALPNVKEPLEHADGTLSVLFSPDGKLLAVGGTGAQSLRVWELESGRKRMQVGTPNGYGGPLAFARDGRSLLLMILPEINKQPQPPDHTFVVRTLEAATGKERASFEILVSAANGFLYALCCVSPDGSLLAAASSESGVRLYDRRTGKELHHLKGLGSPAGALAFSADGKRLACGDTEGTLLIWDLTRLSGPAAPKPAPVAAKQLESLWAALAGAVRPAYAAMQTLSAAAKQAVPFLHERLRPGASPVPPERIARLIADLNAKEFGVRDRAQQELGKIGKWAGPALREALAGKPALEVRRRVEVLLARLDGPPDAPHRLQALRALEVLEGVGGAEARRALDELARTALEPWLADEARTSAHRAAQRE